jgi:hypothetical protein
MAITGDDGKFALRCWPDGRRTGAAHEIASHDGPALRAQAADLARTGAYGYVEILAWNVELNDWVRVDEAVGG